jgi:NitT/TauT family transport system permease protein
MTGSFMVPTKASSLIRFLASSGIWIALWAIISHSLGKAVLLPSPLNVLSRLIALCQTSLFWKSIAVSSSHILLGFGISCVLGITLAVGSSQIPLFHDLIRPPVALIKAMPVAAFSILALLWIKASSFSILVSCLMSLPLMFTSTREGISQMDPQILQMLKLFHVNRARRLTKAYIPSVLPYALSGASGALGIAWKSGIAAEVIGLPAGTMGLALYKAKITLETGDVFAFTLMIILLCALSEFLLKTLAKRLRQEQ